MCTTCGSQINRYYWQRAIPDAALCRNCFLASDDVDDQQRRSAIAQILKDTRNVDRRLAVEAHDSLRGKGVPANPRRRRTDAPKA